MSESPDGGVATLLRCGIWVLFVVSLAYGVTGTAVAQSAPDCSNVDYQGSGTEADPYQVPNVDELQCIEDQSLGANYTQVSDIDASGTASWNNGKGFEPIGELGGENFTGTFDGNGYNITGLIINRGRDKVGLFGSTTSSSKVTRVSVTNADISGREEVGGVVGYNTGNISDSHSTGNINGNNAGGVVGYNEGNVSGSHATSNVNGRRHLGGLVGQNIRGNVSDSYAVGDVNGSEEIGRLAGEKEGNISDSYATGNVNGSENADGVLGGNDGRVTDSYWDVQKTNQQEAVGREGGNSKVEGDIMGLTTDEMHGGPALGNMTAFDFTTTWRTVTNPDGYPVLAWEKGGSGPSIDDYRDDPSDPTSAVSLSGLQDAIDDFVNNNISLSLLQNVIREFVAT